MKTTLKLLLACAVLATPLFSLTGCGCGFDCSSDDDDDGPGLLTLSLSDSLPEELEEVFITIDSITLNRSGSEDVTINTFTVNAQEVDTVQVDLLDYPGARRLQIVDSLAVETGSISSVELSIIADDVNSAYVLERDSDEQLPLDVASSFTIPGFRLNSGEQEFVIEFSLARALNQSSSGDYRLSTEGVDTVNVNTASILSGTIDSALFDSEAPCSEKESPTEGNRLYLYEGSDLGDAVLADVFNSGNSNDLPDGAVAPIAVASINFDDFGNDGWRYSFGHLPAGEYTMAFACDTSSDDSVSYDELTIPFPENQVYPLTLTEGQDSTCNITQEPDC